MFLAKCAEENPRIPQFWSYHNLMLSENFPIHSEWSLIVAQSAYTHPNSVTSSVPWQNRSMLARQLASAAWSFGRSLPEAHLPGISRLQGLIYAPIVVRRIHKVSQAVSSAQSPQVSSAPDTWCGMACRNWLDAQLRNLACSIEILES
jgi:hypothetical protein